MFKEILKASRNNQASIFAFTFKFKSCPFNRIFASDFAIGKEKIVICQFPALYKVLELWYHPHCLLGLNTGNMVLPNMVSIYSKFLGCSINNYIYQLLANLL